MSVENVRNVHPKEELFQETEVIRLNCPAIDRNTTAIVEEMLHKNQIFSTIGKRINEVKENHTDKREEKIQGIWKDFQKGKQACDLTGESKTNFDLIKAEAEINCGLGLNIVDYMLVKNNGFMNHADYCLEKEQALKAAQKADLGPSTNQFVQGRLEFDKENLARTLHQQPNFEAFPFTNNKKVPDFEKEDFTTEPQTNAFKNTEERNFEGKRLGFPFESDFKEENLPQAQPTSQFNFNSVVTSALNSEPQTNLNSERNRPITFGKEGYYPPQGNITSSYCSRGESKPYSNQIIEESDQTPSGAFFARQNSDFSDLQAQNFETSNLTKSERNHVSLQKSYLKSNSSHSQSIHPEEENSFVRSTNISKVYASCKQPENPIEHTPNSEASRVSQSLKNSSQTQENFPILPETASKTSNNLTNYSVTKIVSHSGEPLNLKDLQKSCQGRDTEGNALFYEGSSSGCLSHSHQIYAQTEDRKSEVVPPSSNAVERICITTVTRNGDDVCTESRFSNNGTSNKLRDQVLLSYNHEIQRLDSSIEPTNNLLNQLNQADDQSNYSSHRTSHTLTDQLGQRQSALIMSNGSRNSSVKGSNLQKMFESNQASVISSEMKSSKQQSALKQRELQREQDSGYKLSSAVGSETSKRTYTSSGSAVPLKNIPHEELTLSMAKEKASSKASSHYSHHMSGEGSSAGSQPTEDRHMEYLLISQSLNLAKPETRVSYVMTKEQEELAAANANRTHPLTFDSLGREEKVPQSVCSKLGGDILDISQAQTALQKSNQNGSHLNCEDQEEMVIQEDITNQSDDQTNISGPNDLKRNLSRQTSIQKSSSSDQKTISHRYSEPRDSDTSSFNRSPCLADKIQEQEEGPTSPESDQLLSGNISIGKEDIVLTKPLSRPSITKTMTLNMQDEEF